MNADELAAHYRAYIALINLHHLSSDDLAPFAHDAVTHNGTRLSRHEYGALILRALDDPAHTFNIDRLIVQGDTAAVRIVFDRRASDGTITPGFPYEGKLAMAEHAFYRFEHGKIREVWSIVESV